MDNSVAEKEKNSGLAAMMVENLVTTVSPVLEKADPPQRVKDAWAEFCASLHEWAGA
jgi:hypothetical protein